MFSMHTVPRFTCTCYEQSVLMMIFVSDSPLRELCVAVSNCMVLTFPQIELRVFLKFLVDGGVLPSKWCTC